MMENDSGTIDEIYPAASLELEGAIKRLYEANEVRIAAELALEERVGAALLAEAISGKNEKVRDAAARQRFIQEFAALEQAKREVRQAELDVRIAELRCDRIKFILRAQEVAVRRRG